MSQNEGHGQARVLDLGLPDHEAQALLPLMASVQSVAQSSQLAQARRTVSLTPCLQPCSADLPASH